MKSIGFGSGEPGNEDRHHEQEGPKQIDYEKFRGSIEDGTADEIIKDLEALPVEVLLEEQGDYRVWSELSEEEQAKIETILEEYAKRKGYIIEKDDVIYVVIPR